MKPKLYKFLRKGIKSNSGNVKWKMGTWKHEDTLDICHSGFHCSREINQAFSFVQGEILAIVETKGKSIIEDDKECWSDMRIVKAWKWQKKDSVELAIYAAELVIDIYEKEYTNDDRPRKAIEAAKEWIKHPTKKNQVAANVYAANANAAANAAAAAASYAAAAAAAYAAAAAANAYAAAAAANAYANAYAAAYANAAKKELVAKIEAWMVKRIKKLESI